VSRGHPGAPAGEGPDPGLTTGDSRDRLVEGGTATIADLSTALPLLVDEFFTTAGADEPRLPLRMVEKFLTEGRPRDDDGEREGVGPANPAEPAEPPSHDAYIVQPNGSCGEKPHTAGYMQKGFRDNITMTRQHGVRKRHPTHLSCQSASIRLPAMPTLWTRRC